MKLILPFLLTTLTATAQSWHPVETKNECSARHESAAAIVGDSLYAIGGRGMRPVDALNLKTGVWQTHPAPPSEMNHVQAVSYDGSIYIMGAFKGAYPHETVLPNVLIYNPKQGVWRDGPAIPAARLRGAGGTVAYNGKIYMVCGITDGHYDGHVAWLDEFDPKTGTWKQLPDAPRTRDHVQVAVVDNKLYVAGGRRSTARIGKVLELLVPEVDVYDFKTGKWSTLPTSSNLPTPRGGPMAVAQDGKVWIIGGETVQTLSHNEAEALDPKTNTWIKTTRMNQGRHGTGAAVYNKQIYVVAGSANHGGGPELNTVEVMK
ncbi:Kelch repeat-containing protein [Spirosoma rhododendri]|uniref:Galactose oxidase n=1 Tax=Spirosoma rhododendri TaxID=2728024 RepID=A0A7L5DGJ5_9BACT|nr:kelch repeat-containing protein [Spirosoma rhododendri]QJD77045.1 galactose oxidase [Spirosoma rhododendri]